MKDFVVFYKLNSRFVYNMQGHDAKEVRDHVSQLFGIHPKFLEVCEKGLSI